MTRRAIGHAIVSEVPIILGVGPFMARVSDADRAWVVERTTLVLMTEDEMPLISQGRSVDDAYDFLLARGPRILVVKQGPAGCTVITQDRLERVPGFQVSVVDSVGAGDCFDAAFLAGYLNGLSLWECGRLANAMRAAAVGKVGAGRNTPTCDDVMTVLRQAGDRIDFPC
jgi:sugar/nucleoside kinase (ribokinase family)